MERSIMKDYSEYVKLLDLTQNVFIVTKILLYQVTNFNHLSLQNASNSLCQLIGDMPLLYSMFHVTWITFKFNRNELGMVSAHVM